MLDTCIDVIHKIAKHFDEVTAIYILTVISYLCIYVCMYGVYLPPLDRSTIIINICNDVGSHVGFGVYFQKHLYC